MPDINIDLDYFEHRKTKRTVGLLGRGADLLPIRMWVFCGKFHAEDGKLIGYSEQEIESACDWWGEKSKMVEAFLNVGWLESIEGGYQVHDWLEHQGHLKAYKKRAKMAADARWARASYATSIPQALQNAPPSNATPSKVKESTDQSASGLGVQGDREPSKREQRLALARDALTCLNQIAGREFRDTDSNVTLIAARLEEIDDDGPGVRKMIERQWELWNGTETEEYMQPTTLFGKKNFGGYYDKRNLPVRPKFNGNGQPPARPEIQLKAYEGRS